MNLRKTIWIAIAMTTGLFLEMAVSEGKRSHTADINSDTRILAMEFGVPQATAYAADRQIDSAENMWLAKHILAQEQKTEAFVDETLVFIKGRISINLSEELELRDLARQIVEAIGPEDSDLTVNRIIQSAPLSTQMCKILGELRCISIQKDPDLYRY